MKSSRFWFSLAVVVCFCLVIRASAQSSVPQLPQRDQTTIQDLKDQIADCTINARSEAAYENKLIAEIVELRRQLAALKAPAPNPGPAKE